MKTSTIVVVPRPGTCNIFSSIIIYSLVMQIYFLYNFIPSQEVCYQLICMLINWSVCWSIDLSVYHLIHLFLFTIKSGKVQLVFVVHVSVFFFCVLLFYQRVIKYLGRYDTFYTSLVIWINSHHIWDMLISSITYIFL